MTTSGTFTFRLDAEEMIAEAYERCSVDPQVLSGYRLRTAVRSLNLLFAEWSTRGINYWTAEQISLPLVQGTARYELSSGVLDILSATILRNSTHTVCSRISLTDYHELPEKDSEGLPTQFFLDRQYTPAVYLWQVPENSTDTFEYWGIKQTEDVSSALDEVDAPYRWTEAICAGLAAKLALKTSTEKFEMLSMEAERVFQLASGDERERATLKITPTAVI